ncbi:hypothetical protein B0H14DRAFT_1613166 [Mycena olivaceomarginata]|nr:hypothetical protein B0H14DRAFT_1613166 [Mycena olivaceomarginata]
MSTMTFDPSTPSASTGADSISASAKSSAHLAAIIIPIILALFFLIGVAALYRRRRARARQAQAPPQSQWLAPPHRRWGTPLQVTSQARTLPRDTPHTLNLWRDAPRARKTGTTTARSLPRTRRSRARARCTGRTSPRSRTPARRRWTLSRPSATRPQTHRCMSMACAGARCSPTTRPRSLTRGTHTCSSLPLASTTFELIPRPYPTCPCPCLCPSCYPPTLTYEPARLDIHSFHRYPPSYTYWNGLYACLIFRRLLGVYRYRYWYLDSDRRIVFLIMDIFMHSVTNDHLPCFPVQ